MIEEMKPVISVFVSGKITDRKLNDENFLQWKQVVEIYVTGRAKNYHLTDDPPDSKTQTWRQDVALLLGAWSHMFMICSTLQWDVDLLRLYSRGSDLSRDYDVIQELFRSKQESWTLAQFYYDFNKFFEEVKEIFSITADVKKMHEM